jgi:hypothetical protein
MSNLVVRPVRFTDNIDPMRTFLEALGLRPRVESTQGGWIDMVAGGGMVALHSARGSETQAPNGFTSLSFEADDVDTLAERLRTAGVPDVVVYDEAYGRVLECRDPLGDRFQVDERSDDLYGYRLHQPAGVASGLSVMPLRLTDPLGPYDGFLAALGCERRGEPSEHFAAYTVGGGDHGLVGLHPPMDPADVGGTPEQLERPGAGYLSFETSEDLGQVAERLGRAGFPAGVTHRERLGEVLSSTDADGLLIEVHVAPPPAG